MQYDIQFYASLGLCKIAATMMKQLKPSRRNQRMGFIAYDLWRILHRSESHIHYDNLHWQ